MVEVSSDIKEPLTLFSGGFTVKTKKKRALFLFCRIRIRPG